MLFWLACEEFRKETNKSMIEEKARVIYEDYISILSPKEVRELWFNRFANISDLFEQILKVCVSVRAHLEHLETAAHSLHIEL